MTENQSRAERRRQKREMSKQKKEKNSGGKSASFLTLTILVLILAISAGYWYLNQKPEITGSEINGIPDNETGEVEVPIMNRNHTDNTDNVTYNSNPPTSGPHFGNWNKDWKFYDTALPIGGLIHNMEHGGVVVLYKSAVDEGTKEQLENFTEDNFKIIASINEDIPSEIALAAWGVYELFDSYDEARFKRFYKANLNNAPENVYP